MLPAPLRYNPKKSGPRPKYCVQERIKFEEKKFLHLRALLRQPCGGRSSGPARGRFEVGPLIDAVFDALSNAASTTSISSEKVAPEPQILPPGEGFKSEKKISSLKGPAEATLRRP